MSSKIQEAKYSNEGYRHTVMKQFFYKMLPRDNKIKKIEKETHDFKEHVPDVYIILEDSKEVAIECQCSIMSLKELKKRTKFYTEKGVYTLWIFDYYPWNYGNYRESISSYIKFKTQKKRSSEIWDCIQYHTKEIERFVYFEMYFRIYCISFNEAENFLERKISLDSIYLTEKSSRYVQSTKFGGGYNKKYQNRFWVDNTNMTRIKNYKLLCIENNGFKLARFYDKHPNNKSTMEEGS